MKKIKAKKLEKVITFLCSERESINPQIQFVEISKKDNTCSVQVSFDNTAYRHELNALAAAFDGLGIAYCYQRVKEDGTIIWELF